MDAVVALLTVAAAAALPPPQVQLIDHADFVAAPGDAAPDAPPAAWGPISLPDRWREHDPGWTGPIWYRFTLRTQAATGELWSVYVPEVNMNAAVFVNGALVGVEGAMDGDLANNWNRPLLFTFPGRLLAAETTEILVKVRAPPHAFGGLGTFAVGPARLLVDRFEWRHFVAISLSQVAAYVAALLCLWSGGIWLGTRREPMYGWFAVAMFCFVIGNLNFHVRTLPVPRPFWEWAVNLAPNGFAVAALTFVHRLVGRPRPRIERLFTAMVLAGGVALAVVPARWFYNVTIALYGVGVAAAGMCAWATLRNVRQLSRFEGAAVLLASVVGTLFGAHDVLVQLRVFEHQSVRLLPHAISACVLILGSIVISRFVRALEAGRRHNAHLVQAVKDREVALAAQFARVRVFERQQLLDRERERLMREVHDGLGGHLASTLAMAEAPSFCREDVVESVRLIAEELSLLVDALDPTLEDLPSLLAILRGRLEPRLARSGLRFEWRVSDAPFARKLEPDELHHLMRIVQEAIANIVKHASARTIVVRTGVEDDRLLLEIRDDGVGLGPPRAGGRGLSNMQQRARQLGAELTVSATSPGTAVVLRLRPAPSPAAQSSSLISPRLTAS